VTDFVHPDSFIPLIVDSYGWMLTGHAVIEEQPPGSPAIALTGRTPLLVALRQRNGADPNVPSDTFGVAFPSGLSAPAMPGGREGQRVTGVSWRFDGR